MVFSGGSRRHLRRLLAGAVLVLAFCVPASDASAKCGDLDLACQIGELDEQLGVTKTAVSALNTTVGFLDTQIATLASTMNEIATVFEQLSEDVVQFVETTIRTMELISAEAMSLTDDMIRRTEESAKLVTFFLEFERDKYLEFVGDDGCGAKCERFREEILNLVTHVETSTNLGYQALFAQVVLDAGRPMPSLPMLDLTLLRDALGNAPGVVLYPLYRTIAVMSADTLESGRPLACESGDPACALHVMNEVFGQVEATLASLIGLAEGSGPGTFAKRTAALNPEDICVNWIAGDVLGVNKVQVLERGADLLLVAAGITRTAACAFDAIGLAGLTSVEGEVGGTFVIEAGFGVRIDNGRTWAKVVGMVARILFEVGAYAEGKLAECRSRLNNAVLQCWLSVKNPVPGNKNQPSTYEWCVNQVQSGTWRSAP